MILEPALVRTLVHLDGDSGETAGRVFIDNKRSSHQEILPPPPPPRRRIWSWGGEEGGGGGIS